MKKWAVRPLIIAGIVVSALAAIAFIVVSTQQERIVNLAVAKLNQHFKGELTIGESSISLFRHFPHVSVVLHEGRFYADKTKQGSPITQFDELYIGFSVPDLLKQDLKVNKISVHGGKMDIIQETDGSINLLEAESSTDTTASDQASAIHLEQVTFQNLAVSFLDKATGRKFNSHIEELLSTIDMDSDRVVLSLNSFMKLDVVSATDSTSFRDKELRVNLAADYKFRTKIFEIFSCNLKLHEAGFNVSGRANLSDTTDVNFHIKGDRQDFNLFTAFLSNDLKEKLKPFQYDGKLHFEAFIRGKIAEGKMPLVEATFGCDDAWFLNTEANKKVDKLRFKGFFTNGHDRSLKTSEVHILNAHARPEKGIFKGHFVVRDFTNPQAVVKMSSQLELKFLGEFFGIQDLKQMTGTIKLDMDFKELHNITLPEESLNKLKEGIQSKLVVENLSFKIPGYPHAVENMNIRAEMRDGRVTVDSAFLTIGDSDIKLSGSMSDLRAFLRDHDKKVNFMLNVGSKQLKLSKLLSYDTALAKQWNDEIQGFNIRLAFETTVRELLNPSPLPRGTFVMKNLRGSFKNYAHTIKDLSATVMIDDTLLRLRDFNGLIDSSDFNFKGKVSNYHLWFDDIKKGKTQIAFDFKSGRFALRDVFTKAVRTYLPRGYRREQLSNVWVRAKIDLKYDTNFRFAKAKLSNVSADLKNHNLKLRNISGGIKYGSKILSFDTLRGMIGNSDFDIALKYYFKGIDRNNNAVANSLTVKSQFLDIDEISHYDLTPKKVTFKIDSTGAKVPVLVDSSQHAQAFNIFMIPFSDFNAQINIGKMKYNRLWVKDMNMKLTMIKDEQSIRIDTLTMHIAGGNVAMRGKFNGSNPQRIFFRSRIKFNQVDLEKMMLKLDHFGQDVVINKNVKGTLNGEIKSYVQVHPNLVPIMSNTKAEINMRIYNGSLVDFAPMQAMAGYFKDKNLRLIRFDTLSNKLTFINGVLDIPVMDINSSLGYIQLSGKQSMDLSMEYYVRVPMKVVTKAGFNSLFNGKHEEVDMHQVDEIEFVDKDKKIAFMNLKVTGKADGNYEVGLGRQKKSSGFQLKRF